MAVSFKVPTYIQAIDGFSKPLGGMLGSVHKFTTATQRAFSAIIPPQSAFGRLVAGVSLGNLVSRGITSAIQGLRSVSAGAISYASDIIEARNVTETVFGKGGAAFNAVTDFASNARKQFGLTSLQAETFASTFGSMLKGMGMGNEQAANMATALTGRAGDISSLFNMDQTSAFNMLRSGISGESEPLKRIGVIMSVDALNAFALSKGLTTAYKDMNEASKAALRYNFIMEQTAVAQGDASKPVASWAYSSRQAMLSIQEMWGKLAQGFMPGLIKIADRVAEIAQRIGTWADRNKALIATKVDLFVNKAFAAIEKIADILPKAVKFTKEWGPAIGATILAFKGMETAVTFVTAFKSTLAAVTAAQTGLAAATGTAAAAQLGLNAAMIALPAAAIIAGTALVITLGEKIRQATDEALRVMSDKQLSDAVANFNTIGHGMGFGGSATAMGALAATQGSFAGMEQVRRAREAQNPNREKIANYNRQTLSAYEQQSLYLQQKQLEAQQTTADNTKGGKTEPGGPDGLKYGLMGTDDFWSIARIGARI